MHTTSNLTTTRHFKDAHQKKSTWKNRQEKHAEFEDNKKQSYFCCMHEGLRTYE
jgi:hypothetical protein